jgi:hypothetical protein
MSGRVGCVWDGEGASGVQGDMRSIEIQNERLCLSQVEGSESGEPRGNELGQKFITGKAS